MRLSVIFENKNCPKCSASYTEEHNKGELGASFSNIVDDIKQLQTLSPHSMELSGQMKYIVRAVKTLKTLVVDAEANNYPHAAEARQQLETVLDKMTTAWAGRGLSVYNPLPPNWPRELSEGGIIEGHIRMSLPFDDKPLPEKYGIFVHADKRPLTYRTFSEPTFKIEGVPPGTYFLHFTASGYKPVSEMRTVEVRAGEVATAKVIILDPEH
jgi:hypothetical protein